MCKAMRTRTFFRYALLAVASAAVACTVHQQETPSITGQCVTIAATPTGSNFSTSQTQTVEIRLMPPGLIVPALSGPTPAFVVAPGAPTVGAPVQFDASTSCGGPLVSGACPATGPSV